MCQQSTNSSTALVAQILKELLLIPTLPNDPIVFEITSRVLAVSYVSPSVKELVETIILSLHKRAVREAFYRSAALKWQSEDGRPIDPPDTI